MLQTSAARTPSPSRSGQTPAESAATTPSAASSRRNNRPRAIPATVSAPCAAYAWRRCRSASSAWRNCPSKGDSLPSLLDNQAMVDPALSPQPRRIDERSETRRSWTAISETTPREPPTAQSSLCFPQKLHRFVGRQRTTKMISLHFVTTKQAQQLYLLFRIHPFGNDLEI